MPEFVLVSREKIHLLEQFRKREEEAEEEEKEQEEEGKEGEVMRSKGHRILPQGPATGHCAEAEFHHLQEKKNKKTSLMQRKRENVKKH